MKYVTPEVYQIGSNVLSALEMPVSSFRAFEIRSILQRKQPGIASLPCFPASSFGFG
jgi:hypothetical protein